VCVLKLLPPWGPLLTVLCPNAQLLCITKSIAHHTLACLRILPPRFKTLRFNSLASQSSVSLLLLSAISIVLPTAALHLSMGGPDAEHLSNDK
jgi:hypothetical protein